MKNKPQISDLDVFCVVVESQSFVGAATELGVSPAFISKRIQILEKTLDCKLLNRSTRNISLTEDGKYIYEQSRRILVDLEYMTEALSCKNDMLAAIFTSPAASAWAVNTSPLYCHNCLKTTPNSSCN